mgnify:CR=1 FL=1
MTLSTLGRLSIEDLNWFLKGDLETRAKNLLKLNITNKNGFLHSSELIEELKFLVNKRYIEKKENLKYEVTSYGREYALGHL